MTGQDNPQFLSAESAPVGIVLERRDSDHPWQDHSWHLVEVVAGGGGDQWRLIGEGPGRQRYFAGTLTLELFPRETEGYKANLSNHPPLVFVVLRDGEADDGPGEVVPFLATVCPYEAQGYDGLDEKVESVAMAPEIAAWVWAFVEAHHVDEPFKKRKQKAKTAEDAWGGRARPRTGNRGGGDGRG